MYSLSEYHNLEEKYGFYSSWAIWNEENPSDTSIIEDSLDELNTRYVFLALNISKPLLKKWGNFHGGKHDRKLVKSCNKTKLRGSYITDIFKGIVDADSSALKNLPNDVIRSNVSFFHEEMKNIKINKDTIFIILGTESSLVSKYFKEYFREGYDNKIINYYHYSYYTLTDDQWVNGLLEKVSKD